MVAESAIAGEIAPRGLSRVDAARYCGLSVSQFLALVAQGILPAPLPFGRKTKLWDRAALDRALDRMSGIDRPAEGNEWMTALHAKQNPLRPAR